jgi:hypothetical protein
MTLFEPQDGGRQCGWCAQPLTSAIPQSAVHPTEKITGKFMAHFPPTSYAKGETRASIPRLKQKMIVLSQVFFDKGTFFVEQNADTHFPRRP